MSSCLAEFHRKNITVPANSTTFDIEFNFTPPAHISGKECAVKCVFFTWMFGAAITTNPQLASRNAVYLSNLSWTQIFGTETDTDTKKATVVGATMNNIFYDMENLLCNIPSGPHKVRLRVSRPDGGALVGTNDDAAVHISAIFKIEPLASGIN